MTLTPHDRETKVATKPESICQRDPQQRKGLKQACRAKVADFDRIEIKLRGELGDSFARGRIVARNKHDCFLFLHNRISHDVEPRRIEGVDNLGVRRPRCHLFRTAAVKADNKSGKIGFKWIGAIN